MAVGKVVADREVAVLSPAPVSLQQLLIIAPVVKVAVVAAH
jgi:hypothetical protein